MRLKDYGRWVSFDNGYFPLNTWNTKVEEILTQRLRSVEIVIHGCRTNIFAYFERKTYCIYVLEYGPLKIFKEKFYKDFPSLEEFKSDFPILFFEPWEY